MKGHVAFKTNAKEGEVDAMNKNCARELLRIEGRILGRKATILIDCGAQDNFVSKAFVKHLHARTKPLKDVSTAKLAEGRTYMINEYLSRTRANVPGGYVETPT